MKYIIEAACGCHRGKIRNNNEDNFYFMGKCLKLKNDGLGKIISAERVQNGGICFAVFDGMGGENYGEYASYAAARGMQNLNAEEKMHAIFISKRMFLTRMADRLNGAVLESSRELGTKRMGSTMVALYCGTNNIYSCNIGDSRAYRLSFGDFRQITLDHVYSKPLSRGRKAPLTQHLGIDPEDMIIEPYISKNCVMVGDQYLLCSDGLTDMLNNMEIMEAMRCSNSAEKCVYNLLVAALDKGGRDNITVINCRIK